MGPAAVLEVTGDSVRVLAPDGVFPQAGPAPGLVAAALDWIDDPVGLLDERPVAVADLWRAVIVALVGQTCRSIAVVHPGAWPRHRIERVLAAANTVAEHVEAISRDRVSEVLHRPPDEAGDEATSPVRRRRWVRAPTLRVALIVVALAAAPAVRCVGAFELPTTDAVATVAEGRMAVLVPADWDVQRVTGGSGSRRLRVSAPNDPQIALNLTWSYAPETTLQQAAEMFGRAMANEAPGVFVDLNMGEFGGRPAVRYRELRPGRTIAWAVVLAGATRIGIGCQSPPGRETDVRAPCEQAARSAREA